MREVLRKGDANGNDMAVRFRLSSGLEIVALATRNVSPGKWDLGPTWNYLILAERPFLVDTGRRGQGRELVEMMAWAGLAPRDLDFVVLSHGHEDHDGGLAEIAAQTGARVKAQAPYERLIRVYPGQAPSAARKDYPAACWHCFLPESFAREHCREYRLERSGLAVEELGEDDCGPVRAARAFHLPGHSPDALALLLDGEAILVGDTVLPEITPFPSREEWFEAVRPILGPEYGRAEAIYGLRAYLRSLKRLQDLAAQNPGLLVLPAHRLFNHNRFQELDLAARVEELIAHHLDRCADILRILKPGPKTAREVAVKHFEESLLEGFGLLMAENEVLSHGELLQASGDVRWTEEDKLAATGRADFEELIRDLTGPGEER